MLKTKIFGEIMKNLLFSSLLGLALIAFTGCTKGNNTDAGAKCSSASKCSGDKNSKKCSTGIKCGGY